MARSARMPQGATLSPGNIIYLYGLLSRTIGTGRQTFLPRVEEALDAETLGAADLGFESTRALLEAMGDCVNLTVFKGGRIYATLVAKPEWDAALAADPGKSSGSARSGKPWKRKKAEKSPKPVKPRRVKREEPKEKTAEEDATTAQDESAATSTAVAETAERVPGAPSASDAGTSIADAKEAATAKPPESPGAPDENRNAASTDRPTAESEASHGDAPNLGGTGAEAATDVPSSDTAVQPTISLTVTYDPYSGTEGETILEADLSACATAGTAEPPAPANVSPAPAVKSLHADRPGTSGSASGPEPADISTTAQSEPSANDPAATVTPAAAPAAAPAQTTTSKAPAAPEAAIDPMPSDSAPVASPAPSSAASVPTADTPGAATPVAADKSVMRSDAEPSPDGPVPSAEALAGYPKDFSEEVYCPHERIAGLSRLLPLGTNVLPLLTEDFERARALELIRGTRAQATFPLRVEHPDRTDPIVVTIHRQRSGSLPWTVTAIR